MASGNFVISATFAGSVTQTNGYWSSTPNYSNNTSTMSVSFYVTKAAGFSTTFGNGTWGINVDGTNYPTSYNISVPASSTVLVHSVSGIVITHNPNGTRSVGISVSGSIPSTSWTSTTGSTTAVLEDTLPDPVFTDSTINPIAIRGVAYSDGVSASNATSYSIVSSSLPSGLSFNTSTGAITGTPDTTFQSRNPVFRATNASGSADTAALSITVNPPAPVFTDSTVNPNASVGSAYSDAVAASDVVSYSVFSGALPAGLTLNTSTGAITGTPTTPETATFVIRATNVTGSSDTPSRTITVISAVRVWVGPDADDFVPGLVNVWVGPDNDDFATGIVKVWDGNTFVSAK
jgi:hypothetical protein